MPDRKPYTHVRLILDEGGIARYEIADPHLGRALGDLVTVVLAVDESAECLDPVCPVPGCCEAR